MEENYYNPSTTDSYFEKMITPTTFVVCGKIIEIDNKWLAKRFQFAEIAAGSSGSVFLFRYTENKIGEIYGRSRTTVKLLENCSTQTAKKRNGEARA